MAKGRRDTWSKGGRQGNAASGIHEEEGRQSGSERGTNGAHLIRQPRSATPAPPRRPPKPLLSVACPFGPLIFPRHPCLSLSLPLSFPCLAIPPRSSLSLRVRSSLCPSHGGVLRSLRFFFPSGHPSAAAPSSCLSSFLSAPPCALLPAFSGLAVNSRAANRSRWLPHSLRTDESFGATVRKSWQRQQLSKGLVCLAMDASLGGSDSVFPRINVRDPYKRLGISKEAGEEEIREARSYLASQYSGHAKSMESIESAYDKIMMEKLREYQKLQFKPKKEVKEIPAWMLKITNMYQVPNSDVIAKRAAFYVLLGLWSVLKPHGDRGPAFQVLISFVACIYFLNDRIKKFAKSFFIGFGALVIGWVFSSLLVPVIPTQILPSSWTLELTSSLFSYIFLWAACTFLR